MPRGRKPKIDSKADKVWDTVKGIPCPLSDRFGELLKTAQKIYLRESGLLEWEVSLKGKKVKPCGTINKELDKLQANLTQLDQYIEKADKWLKRRRKLLRKAKMM